MSSTSASGAAAQTLPLPNHRLLGDATFAFLIRNPRSAAE